METAIQIRSATPADEDAVRLIAGSSFGRISSPRSQDLWRADFPVDNSIVAAAGGQVVGHLVTATMSLTVPGPAQVPAAGVSTVAVSATHRRRGVMRLLFSEMHRRIEESGVPLAILTASEGGIYGRFGYCAATLEHSVTLDRRFAGFVPGTPSPDGVTISPATAVRAKIEAIYARWQAITPGAQARPAASWEAGFEDADKSGTHPDTTPLFALLHADGYALYRYARQDKRVSVESLCAATPQAHAALWRTLASFDLFDAVNAAIPDGDPLPYLLTNPRMLRVRSRQDELWLRIIDVPQALTARHYLADLDLVLEVSDPFRGNGGRYALRIRDGVAGCSSSTAEPDVSLGIDVLSGLYLGTHHPAAFAAAGRLHARDARTLRQLGFAFASARPAQLGWGF